MHTNLARRLCLTLVGLLLTATCLTARNQQGPEPITSQVQPTPTIQGVKALGQFKVAVAGVYRGEEAQAFTSMTDRYLNEEGWNACAVDFLVINDTDQFGYVGFAKDGRDDIPTYSPVQIADQNGGSYKFKIRSSNYIVPPHGSVHFYAVERFPIMREVANAQFPSVCTGLMNTSNGRPWFWHSSEFQESNTSPIAFRIPEDTFTDHRTCLPTTNFAAEAGTEYLLDSSTIRLEETGGDFFELTWDNTGSSTLYLKESNVLLWGQDREGRYHYIGDALVESARRFEYGSTIISGGGGYCPKGTAVRKGLAPGMTLTARVYFPGELVWVLAQVTESWEDYHATDGVYIPVHCVVAPE